MRPIGLLRLLCVLCVASASFLPGPAVARSFAQEQAAGETGTVPGHAASEDDGDDDVVPRTLPSLEPGTWAPLFEMGGSIYPSAVLCTATLKEGLWDDKRHLGDPWGDIGIAVRGTEANCPVRVEITGGNFIKSGIFAGTLADQGTVYCVYPELVYDYEKLLAVKQTIPETLSFKVTIGAKSEPEKVVRVQVRPVNECVFSFVDSSGDSRDTSYFFAAYVNENHPFVSRILKEAIAAKRVDSFSGYSGDAESVREEIGAIWDTLKRRGIHYSAMPASADDDDPYVDSQYVRLLGESIDYAQANCVDGSVLMASIFRKIGLDVSLVELPEHMLIAVALDGEGKDVAYIETTDLSDSTLEEAMEAGREQYEENESKFDSQKPEEQAYNIIDIQAARVMGIMPIKDSSAH